MKMGFLIPIFGFLGAFRLWGQCERIKSIAVKGIDFCFWRHVGKHGFLPRAELWSAYFLEAHPTKKLGASEVRNSAILEKKRSHILLGLAADIASKLLTAYLLFIEHSISIRPILEADCNKNCHVKNSVFRILPNGLVLGPLLLGAGKTPEIGKFLKENNTGYLKRGNQFCDPFIRKQTFPFTFRVSWVTKW